MKRKFLCSLPGLSLNAIPEHQEFIGGRWINYASVVVSFTPDYETDDPAIIRAIRRAKGYGTTYKEYDPETKRAATFPVDYGLPSEDETPKPDGKPITVKTKDLIRK